MVWFAHRADWIDNSEYDRSVVFSIDAYDLFGCVVEDLLRMLFVLGSGGHTTRGLILSEWLNEESYYMVPWESDHTKKRVKKNYFSVISPRIRAKSNRILTIIRTLFLFCHSLIILLIVRPNIVISTGSGISFPTLLLARLFRAKSVYIESPSRVHEPSIAGRMLIGKVTRWFSSWKELAETSEEIEYGGIIS